MKSLLPQSLIIYAVGNVATWPTLEDLVFTRDNYIVIHDDSYFLGFTYTMTSSTAGPTASVQDMIMVVNPTGNVIPNSGFTRAFSTNTDLLFSWKGSSAIQNFNPKAMPSTLSYFFNPINRRLLRAGNVINAMMSADVTQYTKYGVVTIFLEVIK